MDFKNTQDTARKKIRINFILIAASIIILFCIATLATVAKISSLSAPTNHLDGAFQTASGLFRLDSGQFPGKDFQPYLGIGPILAIFPFYKIAGSDLAATVFAAKFVTLCFAWLAITVIWHLIVQPRKFLFSFVVGAIITSLAVLADNNFHLSRHIKFALDPGNSLRPVRAAGPFLLGIIVYLLYKRNTINFIQGILSIFFLGITLLWSNDFALPTYGIFLLLICACTYSADRMNWVKISLAITLCSIIFWGLLLFFITSAEPTKILRYNFFDIARDQWWYFGPYQEKFRIFDAGDLSKIFSRRTYFPTLILIITILLAYKKRSIEYIFLAAIGLTLFSGGCLASIGGHVGGYFSGFYFWGLMTASILIFKLLFIKLKLNLHLNSRNILLLLFIGLILQLVIYFDTAKQFHDKNLELQHSKDKFYVPELGAYLENRYSDYIDIARKNKGAPVIEEYWGIWSSLNRDFSHWPVDSVIHALGKIRESSKTSFEKAQFIITTKYSTSPEWQPWIVSQNFWFYEELIENWKPVFASPTTIVWKRTTTRLPYQSVQCNIINERKGIELNSIERGPYRITLTYKSAGGRHLLLMKNNISSIIHSKGYISLPPGNQRFIFPLSINDDTEKEFHLKILGNATAEIFSCEADRITHAFQEIFQ